MKQPPKTYAEIGEELNKQFNALFMQIAVAIGVPRVTIWLYRFLKWVEHYCSIHWVNCWKEKHNGMLSLNILRFGYGNYRNCRCWFITVLNFGVYMEWWKKSYRPIDTNNKKVPTLPTQLKN